MALLFSAVTLTAEDRRTEFLAAGFPKNERDLAGWTAYESFMSETPPEHDIGVHVSAYTYGGGEVFIATPEEVAYFKMRADRDGRFLAGHCESAGSADFTIQAPPNEILGVYLEL